MKSDHGKLPSLISWRAEMATYLSGFLNHLSRQSSISLLSPLIMLAPFGVLLTENLALSVLLVLAASLLVYVATYWASDKRLSAQQVECSASGETDSAPKAGRMSKSALIPVIATLFGVADYLLFCLVNGLDMAKQPPLERVGAIIYLLCSCAWLLIEFGSLQ